MKGVIEDVIEEKVEPYFQAIQNEFNTVHQKFNKIDERFDQIDRKFVKLENMIDNDYKRRIEKLEGQVNELRDTLAMK